MDVGEQAAVEEAEVEMVGVEDACERLGPFDRGLPVGSSSGSGSGADVMGSPNGSIMNGGKPQRGGKLNCVPHPNMDLNIPDPHPGRFGSFGLPPRPSITIP